MVPTVREADGLALSSRNRYLNSEERALAPLLYQSLQEIQGILDLSNSNLPPKTISESIREQHIRLTKVGFRMDYLGIYHKETLQPVSDVHTCESVVIAGAAWLGSTRLIDNIVLS
jgi:pantoate--beta-alanine ligase